MDLSYNDIITYIRKYLNRIFKSMVRLTIQNKKYILNNKLEYKIYEFWKKSDTELIQDFNNFSFKEDYIGTIFFFLSGYWEYVHNNFKDKYKRFPYKESFQYKKKVVEEPIVDILVDKIKNTLNLEYKDNRPTAFITHDIDRLCLLKRKEFYKGLLGDILKRKDYKFAINKIFKIIKNNDPHNPTVLIDLHKKYITTGTFFFMPAIQPRSVGGGYDLKKNLKFLNKLGAEINKINGSIGIHYDVRYIYEDRLLNDIDKLNKTFDIQINSGRAHYLIFDIEKSFDILEKSGIKLDTTGGYAEHIGFRFGTSKPFKPYNFKTGKEYNILEVPLIIMDGTLLNKKYMNLLPEEGFNKIKNTINKIEKYNGVFTFLWHNSSFYTNGWKDWEGIYESTLEYLRDKNFEFINTDSVLEEFYGS